MNGTTHIVPAQIPPEFSARVLHDVPMSKHTSWHAGGTADIFFTPRDTLDLASFLRQLPPAVPVLWIGLGSNLLVRDGGVRGAVVSLHGALGTLERLSATRIQAQAGVPCARIARQCVKWGLGPAEFFAGIPGTLGGALAMNAGAWDGETWRQVVEVDVIDRSGTRHVRTPADYEIGYRHVRGPEDEWFVAARLEFERKPGSNEAAIRELLERRKQTQPIGEWSCGSVFTNPPGQHAARLIESAGLKGFRIGDASVSEKHANFIINHGAARAADLEALILHVQRTVADFHHVELTTEVRIVGEPKDPT
ncbi:MAG: UDP-N-acetylmuramate dehydrogenase [Gammaproteobacteria bacterium]|jgi:UDP-N-acetylmuramate dehydrogenase|nr:UDP-N-acetylmuramate dehydrogenase [Gammaproteobacteria bacterium]